MGTRTRVVMGFSDEMGEGYIVGEDGGGDLLVCFTSVAAFQGGALRALVEDPEYPMRWFLEDLRAGRERPEDWCGDRSLLGPLIVGLLLFSVVASSIAGAGTVFFSALLAAWILLPVLVGVRDALDAGCVFMLISLGIVVVVDLAQNGLDYLLP